jgi:hypothetical protein
LKNLHPSSKLTSAEMIQRYFAENRARVLELAAFLDRLEHTTDFTAHLADHRVSTLLKSISELLSSSGDRVLRIQEILSDPSKEPLPSAPLEKSASGAPSPSQFNCC